MDIAAWVTAICAVCTLLGVGVIQWSNIKSDVKLLQATVTSLDKQLAMMIRSQLRLEALVVGALGKEHPLSQRIREDT